MARSFGIGSFRKAVFKYVMPMLFNHHEDDRIAYEDLYR